MDNNPFDEALQRVAGGQKLPYDPDAWTRMSARLDAHSSAKKRRIVLPFPVVRWAAAAAVVAAALATGWWLRDASKQTSHGTPGVVHHNEAPTTTATTQPSTTQQDEPLFAQPGVSGQNIHSASRQSAPYTASPQSKQVRERRATLLPEILTQKVATAPTPATPSPTPPKQNTQAPLTPAPRPSPTSNFAFLPPENQPQKSARGTGFDLAGGYGFGGELPTFSVGVAVKQALTSRLQLEGALAIVGSTPDPIGSASKADDASPASFNTGNAGIAGGIQESQAAAAQATAEYEDLRARQLFVQAAPVLMYRVAGGFSAGGGLDAQRRVSANSATREQFANSFEGVSVPALPEWDFGLALRADYRVTKKLRFGVQYRESLRATAAGGGTTDGRNYWLLQAGYGIR